MQWGFETQKIPGIVFYTTNEEEMFLCSCREQPTQAWGAFPSGKRGGTIMTEEILSVLNGEVFGVWFLMGAALVFWMQAGFAMVETGFTSAKNAGNILMKNLMDFCIGIPVVFILIGFSLLLGEDMAGIIGKPGFDIFTSYANFDWSNFVFNLVFCATTATIVSGAMAERTRFLSYCVYSGVISAVIYPIEAHWTWGGGWLSPDRLPRFRRFQLHPHGRRYFRSDRCSNAWSPYW